MNRLRLFFRRWRYALGEGYRVWRGLPEPPDEPITPEMHFKFLLVHSDLSDDRAATIMWASFLDNVVTEALKHRMLTTSDIRDKLFGGYGPLGPFAVRIDLGLCLGLYSKEVHHDLHIIRRIRNDFAHTAGPVHFYQERIIEQCNRLKTNEISLSFKDWDKKRAKRAHKEDIGEATRRKFKDTTLTLAFVIAQASNYPILPIRDDTRLSPLVQAMKPFL